MLQSTWHGKLAVSFFQNHPELKINFRSNVIILNKTPIHTAKTNQLAFIMKNCQPEVYNFIFETQEWMAKKTAELQLTLNNHTQEIQSSTQIHVVVSLWDTPALCVPEGGKFLNIYAYLSR